MCLICIFRDLNFLIINSGLFGLSQQTSRLEVAIVYFQEFIPEIVRSITYICLCLILNKLMQDVPLLESVFDRLKRTAKDIHSIIIQQSAPENEKIHSDVEQFLGYLYLYVPKNLLYRV